MTSRSLFFLLGKSGISRQTTNTDYRPPSQSGKLILHYILFKQVYVAEKVRESSWKGLLYLLVSNLFSFLKRASSKNFCLKLVYTGASLVAQIVKHLSAMQETRVHSLG